MAHLHYSQEQADKAISEMLARLRNNAPADANGQLRLRVYEALVPVLMQNQIDEMNGASDPAAHIAHTFDVFGWWLAHLARNFSAEPEMHVQFVVAGCSDIGNAAVRKLGGPSIATVQGETGGHA